jgi:iron(III) transport system substrate-binding protein
MGAGLAACGGDDEGADGESSSLTVYSGREEELVAPLLERFEEETGTTLVVRYGAAAARAATILEEGDNSPADVFFSQDAGALGALQKEGLLAELPDELVGEVDPRFRSAEGRWVGTSGRARVVAYNTEAISEEDLPDSVLDFTDEQWSGRLGWAPTNSSFQAFVTAMRVTEGEEVARAWLEGIVANEPEELPDNEAVRDAVASGEIEVGFVNHYYVAQAREEEGTDYPVEVDFPAGGDVGSLVNVAGVGILESSDGEEAAGEFARFLLSDEAQTFFSEETKEYPLIEGVEADPLVVPLAEIEQPDVDLSNLDDLQGTLTLIQETGAL